MKLKPVFTAIVAIALLAACADMATLHSRQFSQELGKQYTQLSVGDTVSTYKWPDTKHFSEKSEHAYAGRDVQPEQPSTWNVPHEYRPELKNAYDMLQIALIPNRKKIESPIAAADAQAYFDCWVQQAQKHWVPTAHENNCRAAFYEAFCRMYHGKCTSAIGSDHIFRIYFALGKSDINDKGREAISKIAETFDHGGNEIIVAGHADRVGEADQNQQLSLERANAVKARLVLAGIPEDKITVKAFGDKLQLVPTTQKNAYNRRVLIVVR